MKILQTTREPCIYKITNLINNKIYIGQTYRFLERMWEHENDDRGYSAIHQAIVKYGTDNFEVEIIETVADRSLLDSREIYWIEYYNSYHNGYNLNKGGGGQCALASSRKIIQYTYDYKNIIQVFDSLNSAGHFIGGTYVTIRACCMGTNGHGGRLIHAYNFGWTFLDEKEEEIQKRIQETEKTGFYSINLQTNERQLFYKQADAAKILKVSAGSIKQILHKKNKTTKSSDGQKYTFKWLFEFEEKQDTE